MAFNPDEYLKKQGGGGGFDPDAYLARGSNAPEVVDLKGAGQAALEQYGNVATAGYLPQLQGGVEKVRSAIDTGAARLGIGPETPEMVDERLRAQGFTITQPEDGYLATRDETLRRLAQQEKEFPKASLAGKAAGLVGSAMLGGKLLGATKGATVGQRIASAAKTGAAYGAATNPGDAEGEIDPLQLVDRGQNAAVGGLLGAGTQGAAEAAGPLLNAIKEWSAQKAALKASRALGRPTPTQAARMAETGQDIVLGRELLDEGAIPFLGTPKSIAGRVESLKEKAGQQIGQIIDQADEVAAKNQVEFTPIRISAPKRLVESQQEVRMTPVRFDENPAKRAFPWLSDKDAPPRLIRGEEQPIQAALLEKPTPKIIRGKTQIIPNDDLTIDANKLAKSILGSSEIRALRKTPGMESAVAAIEKQVETLAKNGRLTLKDAQTLRQGIDRSINFNKAAPEMRGAQEGLYKQRTALRDAMNDVINKLTPEAGRDALKAANRRYSNLSDASDILEREIGRNQANRSISLTDTIAGAAGASTGSPFAALALGTLNKAGRTFGNSIQARGLDVASTLAGSAIPLAGSASQSSPAMQAMVSRLTNPAGKFQESEFREILNDPKIMQQFQKDPGLLDAIQNDKLRAAITRKIGRKPAASPMQRRLGQ